MRWFKKFAKNKVDTEILDLYLQIELLVQEIDDHLQGYLRHLHDTKFYLSNKKNKSFYSIQKVQLFFNRLKQEYANCYTLRENQKHYNFSYNSQTKVDKINIEIELNKLINLLERILEDVTKLDKQKIKQNDLTELTKYIKQFIEEKSVFEKLKKDDEKRVLNIINKIVAESKQNKKEGLWLVDQKKGKLVSFSRNQKITEIKLLELVPLLELKDLEKRSLFINQLHKDKTLPVFHYNLELGGDNIHVIPRGFKDKIKPFLKKAA